MTPIPLDKLGAESDHEEATIERLQRLGYDYEHGPRLERELPAVVLADRLRAHLARRYPHLPDEALAEAVATARSPDGVTLAARNMAFHRLLTRGFELAYEGPDGETRYEHVYLVDYDDPEANDFLVVNQLSVQGERVRRPDLVVFVNGLPLVVFELKSPRDEYADVHGAYNQLGHYQHDIPRLFDFNAFCVLSDGVNTQQGTYSADWAWFTPWKSSDGQGVAPPTEPPMQTLVEGLFPKHRLLDYVRHFILHETVNERITKKGAKYHQFFAVRRAVRETLRATGPDGDRRIGVVWHTQGSGKSLSMVFLIGILRRHPAMENPTFVVQVDRTDLDNQLYDQLVAARPLVGTVRQAESIEDLRELLRTEGGEVICATLEKFQTRGEEVRHPVLSERRNLIVMADEAHRSQYGFVGGFADHLRRALPNASFIGFTGTPIDKQDASTTQVFGTYIHTYDMQQAKDDGAVVGILYEPRLIELEVTNPALGAQIDALIEEHAREVDATQLERAKMKWATLEELAGRRERLNVLARDLLDHFDARCQLTEGKGMVVCMSRHNCVRLYDALTAHDDCPEVKVVMTGSITDDPPEWSAAGHITSKREREAIKERFVDPDDPLRLVIVCDMWLTGFDNPCLHTLYVDKPMRGHNLMQAIARVNRVFRDKPSGLIVDYIGIGDELRAATRRYTAAGGTGELAPELATEGVAAFEAALADVRALVPDDQPYDRWETLSKAELEDLTRACYGVIAPDDERREDFLAAEKRLSQAFSLIAHLEVGREHAQEVAFYQLVRRELRKTAPQTRLELQTLRGAVRDVLDESITASAAVDIYRAAGLERPDVSILGEDFLGRFEEAEQPDLQLTLLEKLLRDEIQRRAGGSGVARARDFEARLDEVLRRYHNHRIEAVEVVATMVEMFETMQRDAERAEDLGLSPEELAFYDAVAQGAAAEVIGEVAYLDELVHDIVGAIKRNLKVDWTKAHRQDVYAGVQSAVKLELRKRRVKGEAFDFILRRVMQQAEASYEDWPQVA